jgi:hypothetical protein
VAQNRWINITLDPNAATRVDHSVDKHGQALGGSASGDLTVSYDTAKFPSASLFHSALLAALQQASGSMTP